MPGALTPQQVKDLIPKDILIFNWFWQDVRAADGRGEPNDIKLVGLRLPSRCITTSCRTFRTTRAAAPARA